LRARAAVRAGARARIASFEAREGVITMAHGWGRHARSESGFALGLLSPTLVMLIVLTGFPILYSIYLSFTDLVLSRGPRGSFVGFENYIALFHNETFVSSLGKTAYYTVCFLVSTLLVGMLVALLLNQEFRGKGFVITCLLIPWAIPKVVNGLIWKWIYDGNFGILNAILFRLGVIDQYKFWFGESTGVAILLISLANTWKLMPFVALMLLAALQTIPRELYDAAKVDGANAFQRFSNVTVPQLKYSLIIICILQTAAAVKLFDIIAVLTQGGPGDRTMVTYYYIYRIAFDYLKLGSASAGAYIVTLVIAVLAVVYYLLFRGQQE
jgi:multiple sugar transport system permease protein